MNETSGYVSLSTSGTDWGYLGGGSSYLPTLVATRVSATNVSATYIQLNSPSTVLACNSGFTGAMRYTSGTMQVCDGSTWGNIGIGVPTGTIAAFAASSCPSGWTEYTASRGRFLRGIDNGAGNDPDGTRAAGNTQNDTLQNITGSFNARAINGAATYSALWTGSGAFDVDGDAPIATSLGIAANAAGKTYSFDASRVARTSTETRPKNVAVTFCVYDGFQSSPGQTILTTLASLTDVSVAAASSGQVLTYSGGTWIASSTSAGAATAVSNTGALQFKSASGGFGGDTDNLYWDNGNKRLGIGTNAPNAHLHVSGTVPGNNVTIRSENSASTGYSSFVVGSAGNYGGLFKAGPGVTGYGGANSVNIGTIAGGGDLALITANAVRVVVKHAGQVGIGLGNGVQSPTATLQV